MAHRPADAAPDDADWPHDSALLDELLDFGIARLVAEAGDETAATELTRLGGSAYTPHFAAPEQVQSGDATAATDVYGLAKALKKRPEERYRNADDLRRHQQHLPLLARPDSAAYRARRFLRRNWLPVGAAAAVALALGLGSVLALRQAERANRRAHCRITWKCCSCWNR